MMIRVRLRLRVRADSNLWCQFSVLLRFKTLFAYHAYILAFHVRK